MALFDGVSDSPRITPFWAAAIRNGMNSGPVPPNWA
jgi:hypothetical protein